MRLVLIAFAVISTLSITACGPALVEVNINPTPSPRQTTPIRAQPVEVISCPSVAAVYNWLDIRRVSPGCQTDRIRHWSVRSQYTYRDSFGRICRADIVEFHNSERGGYSVVRRYAAVGWCENNIGREYRRPQVRDHWYTVSPRQRCRDGNAPYVFDGRRYCPH